MGVSPTDRVQDQDRLSAGRGIRGNLPAGERTPRTRVPRGGHPLPAREAARGPGDPVERSPPQRHIEPRGGDQPVRRDSPEDGKRDDPPRLPGLLHGTVTVPMNGVSYIGTMERWQARVLRWMTGLSLLFQAGVRLLGSNTSARYHHVAGTPEGLVGVFGGP